MTEFLASLKGYRTILINAVLALVGVLVALGVIPASQAVGVTQEMLSQNIDALIGGLGVAGAAVNILLRLVTTTPAGKQAPKVAG